MISIVVRTLNEEKHLFKVLKMLYQQTVQDFELIIVDNCSSDATLSIVAQFPFSKLVLIPRELFNHSLSLNLGVFVASYKFVVLLNGHSIPWSKFWLESGLKNFNDLTVAAIDGNYTANIDGSFWEKLFDLKQLHNIYKTRDNLPLTFTNAIIRKDLWLEYQFDENLPECEDYDWALEMIQRGYKTIKEPKFNVFHSHHLSLKEIRERENRWKKVCNLIDSKTRPSYSKSIIFQKGLSEIGVDIYSYKEFKHKYNKF